MAVGTPLQWATSSPALLPSQRSVLNTNFVDFVYDYQFIDHVLVGSPQLGPISQAYSSPDYYHTLGNPTWSTDPLGANLDANGWPRNYLQVDGNSITIGNHILIPAGTDYGQIGNGYTIQWSGDGRLQLATGTWSNFTVISGSVSQISPGIYEGTDAKFTVNFTGVKQSVGWRLIRDGHLTGSYFRNLHIYRTSDAADFAAGNVFRTAYKQLIVSQCPSAIRTMNWHGGNNSHCIRYENRARWPFAVYGGGYATVSLAYGQTTGTAPFYVVAAVAGTPASMQHGEICTTRLHQTVPATGNYPLATATSSTPGAGQTQFTVNLTRTGTTNATTTISSISTTSLVVGMSISGADIPANTFIASIVTSSSITITNAATGSNVAETLNIGHGFTSTDTATFRNSTTSGWTAMHFRSGLVTVVDMNTFYVTMDSTGFGAFVASGASAQPLVTLQVGSGNDRTAYPVLDTQAYTSVAALGSANFFHATDYRTMYFDKTVSGQKDSSGNLLAGVWMVQGETDLGSSLNGFATLDSPAELGATLVRELNAMAPAQPIHLWLNFPSGALMSMDPDYTTASDYAANTVSAVMAILPRQAHLFVEYSNETWNGPSAGFTQNQYLMERTLYRVPTQAYGITSYSYMHSLRSTVVVNDILTIFGANPRVHFILAGQGAVGLSTTITSGLDNANTERAYGTTLYHADSVIRSLAVAGGVTRTGDVNGTTTLNNVAVAGLSIGMGVIGLNVTSGAQISAIGVSSVTLTIAATGTSTGQTYTFSRTPISYQWGWASGAYFDPPTSHTATFTGTISGTTLTVAAYVGSFSLAVGDFVVGAGVSVNPNTTITALLTGTGGNGTYTVSVSQSIGPIAMSKAQYMAYSTGTGTFTDDSAMYNGTDNSANSGANYSGAANPTQAIANLTAQNASGGDSQSVALYQGLATTYTAILGPMGVYNTQYEGGYEMDPTLGASYGGHTITAADQLFITGWQASASWSSTIQAYLTTYRTKQLAVMPTPFYNMIGQRWGQTAVNNTQTSPDDYSGQVEGAALNLTWSANGTANRSLV